MSLVPVRIVGEFYGLIDDLLHRYAFDSPRGKVINLWERVSNYLGLDHPHSRLLGRQSHLMLDALKQSLDLNAFSYKGAKASRLTRVEVMPSCSVDVKSAANSSCTMSNMDMDGWAGLPAPAVTAPAGHDVSSAGGTLAIQDVKVINDVEKRASSTSQENNLEVTSAGVGVCCSLSPFKKSTNNSTAAPISSSKKRPRSWRNSVQNLKKDKKMKRPKVITLPREPLHKLDTLPDSWEKIDPLRNDSYGNRLTVTRCGHRLKFRSVHLLTKGPPPQWYQKQKGLLDTTTTRRSAYYSRQGIKCNLDKKNSQKMNHNDI